MKIVIKDNMTFEDFGKQIVPKPKEELIDIARQRIIYFEEEYEISSKVFYNKYIDGQMESHNEDFDDWYYRILMFSKYMNVEPESINFISRG